MTQFVLDASAIIGLMLGEMRTLSLTPELLVDAVASAVNMAEVQTKLVREGYDPEVAWMDSLSFVATVLPYTAEQAKLAGSLVTKTRHKGLSFGDRSCLALAITLNCPIYTSDEIWESIDFGIPIHVLR